MKITSIIMILGLVSCGTKEQQNEKIHAAGKFMGTEPKPTSPPACSITASFSLKGMTYDYNLVTWGEAVNNAPAGKRLITRGEAIMLWDAGAFKNTQFNVGQSWTASLKDDGDVYALNTVSGWLDYSSKNNQLSAIYVDK